MDKNIIKQKYIDACNAYLEAFCEKHGFDYDEAANSRVAGVVGGCCLLGNYCVPFNEMKIDIDMDAPKKEYWEYYDYFLESQELGFICPITLIGCVDVQDYQKGRESRSERLKTASMRLEKISSVY